MQRRWAPLPSWPTRCMTPVRPGRRRDVRDRIPARPRRGHPGRRRRARGQARRHRDRADREEIDGAQALGEGLYRLRSGAVVRFFSRASPCTEPVAARAPSGRRHRSTKSNSAASAPGSRPGAGASDNDSRSRVGPTDTTSGRRRPRRRAAWSVPAALGREPEVQVRRPARIRDRADRRERIAAVGSRVDDAVALEVLVLRHPSSPTW